MSTESLGATQRSIASQSLTRTLLIGLAGSMVSHTVAIAGVSYLASTVEEPLEVTTVERVELDPEPKPTPVAKPIPKPVVPIAKPLRVPEPKIVKPIIAALPIPKPVAIPMPKPIATPVPVVKITKAKIPVNLPTEPLAKVIPPKEPTEIVKPLTPIKETPPKIDAPRERLRQRSQPATKTPDRSNITNNQPALGNTSRPATIPAMDTNDILDPNPDDSTPIQPGNNNKLARATETTPSANNQTGIASNKSPQSLGKEVDSIGSNSPVDEDFGAGVPGNNARIATNRNPIPDGASNQTGLGSTRTKNTPNIGDSFSSGDSLGGSSDSLSSDTPGNNTRIARGSSGIGTGGKSNNQTGLGGSSNGSRRTGSRFGALDGTGNGGSSDTNGNDELGTGTPGNVATGGNMQLSIQCLSNCEIRYPDNLEATDTGKDKILVKVTINAKGTITNAQIARSSGNPKLDSVTLAGVKQMQLTAMGKPLTFKIKVSTLVNN